VTESAHGIILRTRPLTETSLIVNWLTPQFGRISTVAKGARRQKSPFAGKVDLFYEADFSFVRSRKTELHNLREVNLREANKFLRDDILRLQRAAYACAFIEQATETETPLPAIYDLQREFLKTLRGQNSAQMIFAFELKMLSELGLEPDLAKGNLTAGTKKIAAILSQKDFDAVENLKLMKPQAEELRQFLHGFLIFHLGRLPKGRANALADQI
jgi:DNA repair protein RecO (recombination protein O)